MEDFSAKTVVITGAASGLGRAATMAFAERNANLVIADMAAEGLRQLESELRARGSQVLCSVGDLSTRAACQALIDAAVKRFGGIDTLCNVAAMLGVGRVENITEDAWNRLMAINLGAPFWLSQAALPFLIARNGSIVNVASSGGLRGQAYTVPYTASKAALIHMTRSMAMEFMNKTVRINAIAPGAMKTAGMGNTVFPEDWEQPLLERFMPLRPPVGPEVVADLMVYLASERASNIHGACLASDGGASAD
jgi:NAD(P)-dependent dehydrogenase (short-subunit alcohol dehydrogenase family)